MPGSPVRTSFTPGRVNVSSSDTQGGSRVPELGPLGSGAARLAAIPAGESPANRGVQSVVVISSGGKGDQPVGSLDVKAPGGWGNSVRSGAARLLPIPAGESPANRGVQWLL